MGIKHEVGFEMLVYIIGQFCPYRDMQIITITASHSCIVLNLES